MFNLQLVCADNNDKPQKINIYNDLDNNKTKYNFHIGEKVHCKVQYVFESNLVSKPLHDDKDILHINYNYSTGHKILNNVDTKQNIADMFTKALDAKDLQRHKTSLGIMKFEENDIIQQE